MKSKKTTKKHHTKKHIKKTYKKNIQALVLTQTRPITSLSLDTIRAIHLITLDPEFPPKIVGSFKYVVHEYPADIDMFETYKGCCSLNSVKKDITLKFIDMAKRIKASHHIYLGDFKAGYDNRYYINIGRIQDPKIINYNPEKIKEDIMRLKENNLLTEKEYDDLIVKVVTNPKLKEFYDLESEIKKKYVIRWTLDEMIQGKKTLPLGLKVTLEDALAHKSIVKIDIWIYLNKRYMEVTNMFVLTYDDTKNHLHTLTKKQDAYEISLMDDLYKYSNRSINKYMKLAKRLWVYAVLKNNAKIMTALYPLFSSSASKMYQITADIETIVNILEHIKRPLLSSITANIEDWKTRLGTVMSDTLPSAVASDIYNKIDLIIKKINDKKYVVDNLNEISDILVIYINKYVKKFLIKNKLMKNNKIVDVT